MIVRLHYADGKTEDFPLRNAVHFADYIQRYDVPGSKFASRPGSPGSLLLDRAWTHREDHRDRPDQRSDDTAPS